MIIFDSDDFGCNHVISDNTQSHDCRDKLDALHFANPGFKATLFAIPGEMTQELLDWCKANEGWIQLGLHGFYHRDNWECSRMSFEDFQDNYNRFKDMIDTYFVKGFKAPGWQISDDIYKWLLNNGWWVADQAYNNDRRPPELRAYIIGDEAIHTHTWDCVGNGIYELYDIIEPRVKAETEFKFISEVV